MKLSQLYQIQKLYFGHEELARVLGITKDSARVAASRYVRQGLLVRIRKNLYMLRQRWKTASFEEMFQIANIVQVPSYISLLTALEYFGLSTQLQRDFLESVALKRTKEIEVQGTVFKYTKISEDLYFGFQRQKDFFIAKPEKALLDALYLVSLGRYSLDMSAVEASKLDPECLLALSERFPFRTRKLLDKYGFIKAA
ncbi:MAG: type IV toxin-antitoxin system AbiEi family antitoxin domain-containing protein [Desulfohalobiaceae bacterium]